MIAGGAQEPFLTVAEVAELLKINQQTVRNWIDQGSLPAVRVGRRVRIRSSDLDQILSAGYQASQVPGPTPGGPTAQDFWSGQPVGVAEAAPPNPSPGHKPDLAPRQQEKQQEEQRDETGA